MFISPSSLTLNSLSASDTITGSIRSATAHSFPDVLPLSTPLAPPLNQSSTLPSSYTYFFSLGSRSSFPSVDLPLTMPQPGASAYPYYLSQLGVVIPSSQSNTGVSVPSDSPKPTTDTRTSAGTSQPPSSASCSNSDIPPRSAASGTTSSLAISSSLSPSLSTNSLCTSGPTSISVTPPPFSTTSPPTTVSSYSSTRSTTLSLLSPPVTTSSQPLSISATANNPSAILHSTTLVSSATLVTSVSPPSFVNPPSALTYTITSFVPVQVGTTTEFVTTSNVLSTEPPGRAIDSTGPLSPGTIAAIVLGIVGAVAFSALWLFCARRRHRRLVQHAPLIPPGNHTPMPLDDEILHADVLGYPIEGHHDEDPPSQPGTAMGARYASILAALHLTGSGRGNEGGSTGGIYGSRHDTATDMDGDTDIARASSPTLPLHVLPPDDPPYMVSLSPPPPASHLQTAQSAPPPSSYHLASRRKSSPAPDAATLLGGYSVAPSHSSYYARSQTLGSGSGSGSVDALTRTRTGSEEPLLGIGKMTTEMSTLIDPGGGRAGFGSAFGSPPSSMHSPGSVYPNLQYDAPGSYGTRSVSGSGSYGYARSATPSSFDVLRSVSSQEQGGLSGAYSQDPVQSQGFRFGFRQGSTASSSTEKKTGSYRQSFGVPPTSFRAWKDRSSTTSDKDKRSDKQSLREKDGKQRPRSWTSSASASGSVDEKQGRASPALGVRAFLGRLRRAGHTPSPHSSNKDLSSLTKASVDVDPEKAAAGRTTPPPIQVEAATPPRRQFSFILSNPDPHPPSPYSGVGVMPSSGTPPTPELHRIQKDAAAGDLNDSRPAVFGIGGLPPTMPFPTGSLFGPASPPVPTEESRLAEGLLHPRLRALGDGDASLRDFEDYSRPIGGVVKNRLYSTTTFGTQDSNDRSPSGGEKDVLPVDEHEQENEVTDVFGSSTLQSILRDSWFFDDTSPPMTTRHLPAGGSEARDAKT